MARFRQCETIVCEPRQPIAAEDPQIVAARRIVDECGGGGIRLEPAAAIVRQLMKRELRRHCRPSRMRRRCESRGAWSYSTVWRVTDRAGISLTAGHETMGRYRLSAAQRGCDPALTQPLRAGRIAPRRGIYPRLVA